MNNPQDWHGVPAVRDTQNASNDVGTATTGGSLTAGLLNVADSLHGVAALLDYLEPWVIAGAIKTADLVPVAQSIETLRDGCRELEVLASAIPVAQRHRHTTQARALPGIGDNDNAR